MDCIKNKTMSSIKGTGFVKTNKIIKVSFAKSSLMNVFD